MSIKAAAKRVIPPRAWALARKFAQRRHLQQFKRRCVEHTYHGQNLTITIADGISEGWYDHDWPHLPEVTRLSASRLKPGAVVFDCGAHQGIVALILAGVCGPEGRVIAIEANDHNAAVARENAERNASGRAAVEVVYAAVGSSDGTITFSDDLNGQIVKRSGHSGRRVVPALTLNTLASQYGQPDVVFLDIEGAEAAALQSADQLVRGPNRPDWFVEVHTHAGLEDLGGSVQEVVGFFTKHGYCVEFSTSPGEPFKSIQGQTLPAHRFYLIAIGANCNHQNGTQ